MESSIPTSRLPRWLGVLMAPAFCLERTRGRKRIALACLYAAILAGVCVLVWRASRLNGLPDIGDLFDPAPLLTLSVPEEGNAFTYYRKASAKAKRSHAIELRLFNQPYSWPKLSDEEGLAYMADNAEALALWRRGCEQPDALYVPIGMLTFETALPLIQEHRHFTRMVMVEASKHVADGDMAGAWGWYRASLRGSRLIGRHGFAIAVLVGIAEYQATMRQVNAWAADPKVDARLLCNALDDVLEINAMTAPTSEAVRIEYLSMMQTMTDPNQMLSHFLEDVSPGRGVNIAASTLWYNHLPGRWGIAWFVQHEPERSRRLVRLAFANWLAQCDKPPGLRPPMVGTAAEPQMLFDAVPDGTPAAALPPSALAVRMESTPLVNQMILSYANFAKSTDRHRAVRASLVITLASQWYARDHGEPPESPEVLVGRYLNQLPDGATGSVEAKASNGPKPR
jgi:hypothetical protein